MFQKNEKYKIGQLFGVEQSLNAKQLKLWNESKEKSFFSIVFTHIDENLFVPLFSDAFSRPNYPVNQLVGAMILMYHKDWTVAELLEAVNFNYLTRKALGIQTLDEEVFCEATFYNFQNRLSRYQAETGVNLFERVFDSLTDEQLKTLKIKTNIQRTDSFLVATNIQNFSRFQLAVEVLRRLHRVLTPADAEKWTENLLPYLKPTSSNQYVYRLKRDSLDVEWQKIGQIYAALYDDLQPKMSEIMAFQVFERYFFEHFTRLETGVALKPAEELSSDCLQSPDDTEATFRQKRQKKSQGYSLSVAETCNPENKFNLITDVVVVQNNVDDSRILAKRLEKMKEKTPDLDELHFDGGYGSEENDEIMDNLGVAPVQTAIKGRTAEVEMVIEETETGEKQVRCSGGQTVKTTTGKKNFKAVFDSEKCLNCPFAEKCPCRPTRKGVVYTFDKNKILQQKRHTAVENLPPERQKIRANVEATMKEMGLGLTNKKLRRRGFFKAELFAFCVAIGVNFGRIHRYLPPKTDFLSYFCLTVYQKNIVNVSLQIFNSFNLKFNFFHQWAF